MTVGRTPLQGQETLLTYYQSFLTMHVPSLAAQQHSLYVPSSTVNPCLRIWMEGMALDGAVLPVSIGPDPCSRPSNILEPLSHTFIILQLQQTYPERTVQ